MSNFVDEAQLNVRGGDGGAGCISFRRESHTPKGGPDGGDGGSGGDIWLQADRNVASLLSFRDHPHRRAPSGTHGSGNQRHGASGADLTVFVPEGTTVRKHDSGEVIADLVNHGDRWLAAHGGRGGRGNTRFLSNARRAPSPARAAAALSSQAAEQLRQSSTRRPDPRRGIALALRLSGIGSSEGRTPQCDG